MSQFDDDGARLNYIYGLLNSKQKFLRYIGYLVSLFILDEGQASAMTFRGGWNQAKRKKYMSSRGYKLTGGGEIEDKEMKDYLSSGKNPLERYLNYELKKLTHDFLVKVDRTSMANSLEVRSPFLDTAMVKNINGASYRNMLDLGNTKKELKKLLNSKGLNKLTRVKKQGFTPPLEKWMTSKTGLDELEKVKNNQLIRELFDISKLSEMTNTVNDVKHHKARLWNLMLLSEWHSRNY